MVISNNYKNTLKYTIITNYKQNIFINKYIIYE